MLQLSESWTYRKELSIGKRSDEKRKETKGIMQMSQKTKDLLRRKNGTTTQTMSIP